MTSVAIVQVKDESEAIAERMENLLSQQAIYQIHWYYYPSEENIKTEIQDLIDFYDVVIVVQNGHIIYRKGKESIQKDRESKSIDRIVI